MIPKVIHYCWFSGEEMSPFAKRCIATWRKKMPDYRLRLWDSSSIQHLIDTVPFVRDSYNVKKWAFVTDYVRLYALYTEGGVYMDTDVKVVHPFDGFLHYDFFGGHEKQPCFFNSEEQKKIDEKGKSRMKENLIEGLGIQAAIMGAVKDHPFLRDCLNYYNGQMFDLENKTTADYVIGKHITRIAANKYGYLYKDEEQHLMDNMCIMKSDVFVGNMIYYHRGHEYAIHLCNGSWVDGNKSYIWRLRNNRPRLFAIISPIYNILFKIWNKIKR